MLKNEQQPQQPFYNPGDTAMKVAIAVGIILFCVVFTIVAIVAIIGGWHFLMTSGLWIALAAIVIGLGVWQGPRIHNHIEAANDRRAVRERENKLNEAQVAHLNAKTMRLANTLPFDDQGNLYVRGLGYVPGQMREFTQLTTYHNAPRITGVREEKQEPAALPVPRPVDLHIPTFAESMNAGLIGPGQKQLLICYQLERDEASGELTGRLDPYQQKQEDTSTLFIGGSSGSGKSTFMTHLALQGAMNNALYYIIDPHLAHPEKSIAARLQALSHAFILPPAQSDAEIYQMLTHAENECRAREHGKETRYSGRPLVFIVDEVLNVFGRAQRTASPEILELYKRLAFFMRDLGTQYNKFNVNGMFASQYVTKDAFRLPRLQVDWRDGCQSQALFRLPPNQAQALRLLERSDLRGARQLPPGHGYMGFMNSDIIRMASGNVTLGDIHYAATQTKASTSSRQLRTGDPAGPPPVQGSAGLVPDVARVVEEVPLSASRELNIHTWSTGELENLVNLDAEPLEQGTEEVPSGTEVPARQAKEFTYDLEVTFVRLYNRDRSIKRCLAAMHLSYGDYQACASRLAQRLNLRKGH